MANNTPKVTPNPIAKDDSAALSEDGTTLIQVLANDLAGGAKQLYSLNQTDPTVVSTTALSQAGAAVSFAADGAVLYAASGSSFDSLAVGETMVDTFIYTLRVANGTLSTAVVSVTVTGTNDGPVIGVADLAGAVTEAVTPIGSLTDSGTIAFGDLDLSDVHTASATAIGSTLGSLTVAKDSDTTGTGTGGQLTWSYSVAAGALEFMAAGETRVESFTVTLDDQNGGVVTQQVNVTLTGTNDGPVIGSVDLVGAVTEAVTPAGNLTDSGTIAFSDVDLSDVHTASATAIGSTLGGLTVAKDSDTTGTGMGGQLTWSYSVAAGALEFMAAGETRVESFTVTLDDQNGGVVTQQVDVTLTGTNDGPVIGAADLAGAVTEAVTPVGSLTDSGTIAFGDVDLSDVHTASATAIGSTLGSLTVSKDSDTTGTGTGGQLTWSYSVAAGALEFMAAGETRVESFTVTLDDQNGGVVTQQVDVTLTGTNDGPVIGAADLVGAVTEAVTPVGSLTDSGTIAFGDVDLSDVHTASATAIGSTLGSLTVSKDSDTTGTGTGGQLTWSYSVAAGALEFMAAGETRVESFTVTLDDQNGGVVTQQVDVTLTGTNDGPVIGAADLVGAVTEAVTPVGSLTDTGTIAFSDVDLTDTHTVSAAAIGSTLGGLTVANAGGQITWGYSVAAGALESMAAGETLVESFTVTLDDQNGGVVTQQVDVTLTGTNDGPVIGAADLIGAVTEAGTPAGNLTDSGTIAFSDVDLTDTHTVSAAAIGTTLGGLTVASAGGQITWTYSAAAAALEFLAAGQTKIESFTITLDDQNGGVVTQQVDVTLTGTNDGPVIGAADLAGAVTEAGTPAGNLTDSGTIAFSDVDLTDTHTASAAAIGTTLGGLTVATAAGQLTWNYSVAAAALESLAAGQTKVESFTVTLDDQHGGVVTRQVNVTLTGTNDGPVIGAADLAGAITEAVTPVGTRTDSGTIAFSDVDLTDTHTASAAPIGSTLGSLAVATAAGQLTWNYSVAATALEYLAAGQTKVESFTVTLNDQHGGVVTRQVNVTLAGTNDAPVITAQDLAGAVTAVPASTAVPEPLVFNVQQYLGFQSNDLATLRNYAATNTASYTAQTNVIDYTDDPGGFAGELPGSFRWPAAEAQNVNGTGGINNVFFARITADFSVTTADTYTFRTYNDDGVFLLIDNTLIISDSGYHGEQAYMGSIALAPGNHTIELFFFENGGEASLEFSARTSTGAFGLVGASGGGLGGANTQLTDSGVISFSDVDLTDMHLVSAAGTPVGSVLGSLTAVKNSDTTGSGTGGQLTWTYTVANSAVESLAAGQTKVESFTITLNDQNGGVVTKQIDVTLTGVNDGPVIGAADLTGAVTEAVTPAGNLTDSGTIAYSDLDVTDTHTVSAAAIGTTLGSLTGSASGGQLAWNYSVAAAALESMAAGQTRVESFTVTLDDQHGGVVTRQVDVTLTGTNDAPVAANDSAATNEDTAITIDVRGNDTDVDGNALSLSSLSGATSTKGATISVVNGNVVYNPAGSATLQALNVGQSTTDTFSYVVSDGTATSTATVTVTVQGAADGPTAVNDTVSTSEDNRIYIDVLANDISATGKTITALSGGQSALGANIVIADGKIFYDPQNASTIQALNNGQSLADTFSYTMRDSNGLTSTASVTVNVAGFTEGTVINSGVSGTMTFNNVTNVNATPLSYTEAGMTVQSLYPPSSGPHLHFRNSFGDASVEIMNHSGCCSTPYEFRYYNPDNTDTTFSLTSIQNLTGTGQWTSSKGGNIMVSTVGVVNFAADPAFQDVEWVRWHVTGANHHVDNVSFTA